MKQMLSRGESRLEVMLKMIAHAKHLETQGVEAEELWERVKKLSVRGQQAFLNEVDDLLVFVKEFSGGINNPRNLMYVRDFIRTIKVEREIPGQMWAAVAKVAVGSKHGAPRFRLACLMAMAAASPPIRTSCTAASTSRYPVCGSTTRSLAPTNTAAGTPAGSAGAGSSSSARKKAAVRPRIRPS